MRAPHAYRGFTLIELIAVITIIAILAAVSLPKLTAATPFVERGYADTVAAHLRQARAVALASGCDLQFSIDAAGFRGRQRAAAGTHCAAAGGFLTTVFDVPQPADVVLAQNRQFVFASDGSVATGPVSITIGPQVLTVDPSGVVQGP
jgi:MSHA pilin protein MshC